MYDVWRRATAAKRIDVQAGYLAARCADDPAAERELENLLDAARSALTLGQLSSAELLVAELVGWAQSWPDDPLRPQDPRPAEFDRQVRDYVKDDRREFLSRDERDSAADLQLSLDVALRSANRACAGHSDHGLQDAYYLYGRATMALDLGHHEAARRELNRLCALLGLDPRP